MVPLVRRLRSVRCAARTNRRFTVYTPFAFLVVLAEVALYRTVGTVLIAAGLLGLASACRSLASRTHDVNVASGTIAVSDRGSVSRANVAMLLAGMLGVAAGVALWAR